MGKEGIIAEHPTLKLKYLDEGMARLALELKEKLEAEREKEDDGEHVSDNYREGEATDLETTMKTTTKYHDESRKLK